MSYFITLYTDASYNPNTKQAKMAWRGKCAEGPIVGSFTAVVASVNEAEALAICKAVKHSLETYPTLEGFFVNSDNLCCVHAFWPFWEGKTHDHIKRHTDDLMNSVSPRWVRTKHVKAHTGKKDVRSYMNRSVDQMTRSKE